MRVPAGRVPCAARMRPLRAELVVLLVALAIAGAARVSSALGLLASFGVAWLLTNLAARWPASWPRLTRVQLGVLALLVALPSLASLWQSRRALSEGEGLHGLVEHTRDRLALTELPAIYPRVLRADRPQRFFVYAPGHGEGVLRLPGADIELTWIGAGVLRADVDPRDLTLPDRGGELPITLSLHGRAHARSLRFVPAVPHPRWARLSLDGEAACVASEESDEIVLVTRERTVRLEACDGPVDCVPREGGALVACAHDRELVRLSASGARRTLHHDAGSIPVRLTELADGRVALALDAGPASSVLVLAADDASQIVARHELAGLVPEWLEPIDDECLAIAVRASRGTVPARVTHRGDSCADAVDLPLAAPVVTMARSSTRGRVWITTTDASAEPHLGNHFVQDEVLALDRGRIAWRHRTARRTAAQDHAGDVDRGASPMGLAERADGTLLVVFAGTDDLAILDPTRGELGAIELAPLGLSAPHGVAVLGDQTLVTSPSSASIVLLDAALSPLAERTLRLARSDRELLATEPDALRVRMGERAFWEATRSGVSCQSCHLHGGSDGAPHNIGGRRLAPTLDVRGITGTSPYLRDGSYPHIGDLLEVAEREYRGYARPGGDRAATIGAWIDTLSPPPPLARELEAERRGVRIFARAGCASCHVPPAFTDLGRHHAALLFPSRARGQGPELLDTPSLLAIGRSAPYLADGRAPTLDALLRDHNEDDRHGATRALSDDELADLVAFLVSL